MNRIVLLALLAPLAACGGTPKPVIVQTTGTSDVIRLNHGFATQIELPAGERAENVAVGNDQIVRATAAGSVVNLSALAADGETNIIVRVIGDDGKSHVHSYRLTVSVR